MFTVSKLFSVVSGDRVYRLFKPAIVAAVTVLADLLLIRIETCRAFYDGHKGFTVSFPNHLAHDWRLFLLCVSYALTG